MRIYQLKTGLRRTTRKLLKEAPSVGMSKSGDTYTIATLSNADNVMLFVHLTEPEVRRLAALLPTEVI